MMNTTNSCRAVAIAKTLFYLFHILCSLARATLAHQSTAAVHTSHRRSLDDLILDQTFGLNGLADRGVQLLVLDAECFQGKLKVADGDGVDDGVEVSDGEGTLEGYGFLLKAGHHHGPVARGTELTLVSVKDDTLGRLQVVRGDGVGLAQSFEGLLAGVESLLGILLP